MPRYDYECVECGSVGEITLPVIPTVMPPVPICCEKTMRRIYQPTNFSVKGYNSANDFCKDNDGWKEKLSLNK